MFGMRSHILIAVFLGTFCLSASAQSPPIPPVTVTVGDPPLIYLGSDLDVLAPITITENYPSALDDGFIILRGRSNAEQRVYFNSATTVSGSVANYHVEQGINLMIEVDADDRRIDTITIQPASYVFFDTSWNNFSPIYVELLDKSAGIGSAAGGYIVGTWAGRDEIAIGPDKTLELALNETITLPLSVIGGAHPALSVWSDDPAIVTVDAFSHTDVTLTGRKLGQTIVKAWTPRGGTGVLYVTVSPPAAPPSPPPTPEPPAVPPAPPSIPEPALPLPEPAMPRLETTTIDGLDVNAVILAGVLPLGSSEYKTALSANEVVLVAAEMAPAPNQVNQFADLFMVVKVTTPAGFTAWFQKDINGRFVPWNGQLDALVPVEEAVLLSELERLEVYEGRLVPGEYDVYFGYWADNSSLIYSKKPLEINVSSEP